MYVRKYVSVRACERERVCVGGECMSLRMIVRARACAFDRIKKIFINISCHDHIE
jgi:hypothetical protein